MRERNFLFIYLDTGGGHKSSARALKTYFEHLYPDVNVYLVNAFDRSNFLGRFFFEKGYHLMCTSLRGLWYIIYEIGQCTWFLELILKFIKPQMTSFLAHEIERLHITDVVSFHFAVTPSAHAAVKKSGKRIKISEIVTDPFTAHSAWFYDKQVDTYVFSQMVRAQALEKYHYTEDKVKIMPILLNPIMLKKRTEDEIKELKNKYQIPKDKKVLLIAGGGEGLPGTLGIVREFIKQKDDFVVIAICGRNKQSKFELEILKKTNPKFNLIIFGFVTFMEELVKICDCAVIKAGPASVFELLTNKKPVIISSFMHGQELGNMRYVVNNKVGYFIQEPKNISAKVHEIFSDDKILLQLRENINALDIQVDCTSFVHHLMEN